jgi:hypothetical protein
MSSINKTLLLSVVFAAACAYAQAPPFQHIIVIVQENRTPDNLFGGATNNPQTWDVQPVAGAPSVELSSCIDPDHSHSPGWTNEYNGGTTTIGVGPRMAALNYNVPRKRSSQLAT